MPQYRRTVQRDANHIPITHDLKKLSYSVIDLSAIGAGVPDILVAKDNLTVLIELKLSSGHFRMGQLEFLANWKGYAGFAETLDDCLNLMRDPVHYGLSSKEKQAILSIATNTRQTSKDKDPRMKVTKFEKLFKALTESGF